MANEHIVIQPAVQVIPTDVLRQQCKVDLIAGVSPEALTVIYLAGAVGLAEHYTGRALGVQTLEIALDAFPCHADAIDLSPGPLVEVESVTYVDITGTEQTLPPQAYTFDAYSTTPWMVPARGTVWPATFDTINAVKVRFVAGYQQLPDAVQTGLLLLTAHLYKNREATGPTTLQEIPLGARVFLDTIKDWSR